MTRKNNPGKRFRLPKTRKERLVDEIVRRSKQYVDLSNSTEQNATYITSVIRAYASGQIRVQLKKANAIVLENLIPRVLQSIKPVALNYGVTINYIPKPPIPHKPNTDPIPVVKPKAFPKKKFRG